MNNGHLAVSGPIGSGCKNCYKQGSGVYYGLHMWLDFVDLDALKQHWNWAEVECQNPQYLIFVVIGMQTIELGLANSYEIISIFADRFYIGSIDKSDIYFGAPKAWRLILDLRAATKQPRCECPE